MVIALFSSVLPHRRQNSKLIDPTVTSGRWLIPEDQNAIVIGNHLLKARPDLKIGDEITVTIDEQDFQVENRRHFPHGR